MTSFSDRTNVGMGKSSDQFRDAFPIHFATSMRHQTSSRIVVPLWKLACAMAVSSGVLCFPLYEPKKDHNGSSVWNDSMNQCFGRNQLYTKCEAVPQPWEKETFEKMALPERFFSEGHAIFGVLMGENMIESYEIYKRPEGSTNCSR